MIEKRERVWVRQGALVEVVLDWFHREKRKLINYSSSSLYGYGL